MKFRSLISVAILALASFNFAIAAELAGKWTTEFDSQIGPQKYVYEFAPDGDKFTGKATYDHSMGKGESRLKDIKLENDSVAFVETVSFDGIELVITYSGKISGDQMDLKRVVGDFATEQIVVKRAKQKD
ncbi:MAG TPA: hypothetical protein VL069_06640 [Opitutus sp.]|nr:hypothetical protein [Opitutus sp.]